MHTIDFSPIVNAHTSHASLGSESLGAKQRQ